MRPAACLALASLLALAPGLRAQEDAPVPDVIVSGKSFLGEIEGGQLYRYSGFVSWAEPAPRRIRGRVVRPRLRLRQVTVFAGDLSTQVHPNGSWSVMVLIPEGGRSPEITAVVWESGTIIPEEDIHYRLGGALPSPLPESSILGQDDAHSGLLGVPLGD